MTALYTRVHVEFQVDPDTALSRHVQFLVDRALYPHKGLRSSAEPTDLSDGSRYAIRFVAWIPATNVSGIESWIRDVFRFWNPSDVEIVPDGSGNFSWQDEGSQTRYRYYTSLGPQEVVVDLNGADPIEYGLGHQFNEVPRSPIEVYEDRGYAVGHASTIFSWMLQHGGVTADEFRVRDIRRELDRTLPDRQVDTDPVTIQHWDRVRQTVESFPRESKVYQSGDWYFVVQP